MEQVIFLHVDEESEETLSQIQRSLAQRLVLVAPAQMDRLRLSMLLRLARRATIAQAKQLWVVSEDRLAQMLARRMGFAVASTLDEYRGLTPGPASPSRKRPRRPPARLSFPAPRTPEEAPTAPRPQAPASSRPSEPEAAMPDPAAERVEGRRARPGVILEQMLVDGYLPNPAATPDLEEEEERAEREERERLHYEIADEYTPSPAQEEAEQHEAQIIARILKTSRGGPPPSPPGGAGSQTDQRKDSPPADDDASKPPAQPPAPPANQPAPAPQSPKEEAAGAKRPTQEEAAGAERSQGGDAMLRPMRTIDELLRERGRSSIFDWFERQAAAAAAALSGSASAAGAVQSAGGALTRTGADVPAPSPAASWEASAASGAGARRLARAAQVLNPARPGNRLSLRPPGAAAWRRIGVIGILTLSLLMLGLGFALIPTAEVRYHEAIIPYSETLLLRASPGAPGQHAAAPHAALAQAEVARFDGVMTAQASASGRRSASGVPNQLLAFPTQQDIDQIASRLQAQLRLWGESALHARQRPGDILGPVTAATETLAFPRAGASLPAGVLSFQVSLALHLRATLVRHAALLQAVRQQLPQDVGQKKPGFAPRAQPPQLHVLSVAPASPGSGQPDLLLRVQIRAMIGPALTHDQARAAIAGQSLPDAVAYLSRQPGITAVAIDVQPKWLNRLPIFPTRIRIDLES